MSNLCFNCKKRERTPFGKIEFQYKHLNFKMIKDGMSCQMCVEKEYINLLKAHPNLFVHKFGKILKIDWQLFCQEYKRGRKVDVLKIFTSLGILSEVPEGNWEIFSDASLLINPILFATSLCFTNFYDAVNYAKEEFSETVYTWQIRRVVNVHNKKTVLEMDSSDRNKEIFPAKE